jgi:hypothetical protein
MGGVLLMRDKGVGVCLIWIGISIVASIVAIDQRFAVIPLLMLFVTCVDEICIAIRKKRP